MAIYRTIQMSFWTDTKVADDFTPEDKYFYLYLMTNPHTNLAGCYEISFTQMSTETGYTKDAIEKLIKRMERVHQVIRYSPATKELLILNWKKYNWTNSPTFRKPLLNEISQIKNPDFRRYLEQSEQGVDTVSIGYEYGIDTNCIDTTDTVTVISNDNHLEEVKPIKQKSNSNKNNINDIYNLLDNADFDIQVKEKVSEWLTYKAEQFKFTYKPTGFKAFLTEISNNEKLLGAENVCKAISLSMGKGYKGIIWDLVKKDQPKNSAYMDAIKNRVDVVDSWM